MPDSKGATEENLTYLLEHFTGDKKTGELSLFQRMEAIDTMREMGIITEEQMKDCFGIGTHTLKTIDINDPRTCYAIVGIREDPYGNWTTFFLHLPLMKANCLDDVFKLVDDQLRFTRAGDQAAEIRAVLERVRPEGSGGTSFTESAYPLYQNHQPSPQAAAYGNPLINARNLDELFEILDRLLRDDTEDDIGDDLQEAFDRVEQAVLKQAVLQ